MRKEQIVGNRLRVIGIAVAFGVLLAAGVASGQSSEDGTRKDTWALGVGMPSGGVSDYYGKAWLNLRLNFRLREDEKSEQGVSLGVAAGMKSKDFSVYAGRWDGWKNSEADFRARLFSLRYNYIMKSDSPLYYGGGAGLYVVNTEAVYNAPDGYQWNANSKTTLSVDENRTAVAPHLLVGYRISQKLGIELEYTILNCTLAGNTGPYSELPSVPDVKMSSLLTLSGHIKF